MDLRRYYEHSSKRRESTEVATGSEGNFHNDDTPHPSKNVCLSLTEVQQQKWENSFQWLHYDEDIAGAFCSVCPRWAQRSSTTKDSRGV